MMGAPEKNTTHPTREPFKCAGYLGAISSSLLVSTSILFVKLLPVEDTIQEKAKACMIRGIIMTLLCGAAVMGRGHSFLIPRDEYWINFLRAIMGSSATLMTYIAMKFISMGECSALVYSTPVWTCLIGFFVLREPLKISLLVALPMSILGIILLAHPDLLIDISTEESKIASEFDHSSSNNNNTTDTSLLEQEPGRLEEEYFRYRLPGIILALGGSIFFSFTIVVLKYRKETPIVTCSFYFGLATALLSIGFQCVTGFGASPATTLEWALHLGIGVNTFVGQCLFQWSLQFLPASSYSVLRSLDIALGFILGALFLDETVLWTSVAGSLLIMLVVIVLMLDDHLEKPCKLLCNSQ